MVSYTVHLKVFLKDNRQIGHKTYKFGSKSKSNSKVKSLSKTFKTTSGIDKSGYRYFYAEDDSVINVMSYITFRTIKKNKKK